MANRQNKLYKKIIKAIDEYGYQNIDVEVNYDKTNNYIETIFIKYNKDILYKCPIAYINLRKLQQFCIYKVYIGYDHVL